MSDPINSPSHYTQANMEVIDILKEVLTKDEFIGYLRGNALKYQMRYKYKGNPGEDLQKAQWYVRRLEQEQE